jgi:outer membrane immunogenic protein
MRRLVTALLTASISLGFAAAASAADMPAKAPVYKAPMVVAPTWAGFYLGVAGGYGWGTTGHTNEVTNIGSGTNNSLRGGIFGVTSGYNWQWGSIVAGLESDFSWSGIKDTFNDNGTGFCPVAQPCVTNLKWLGTDRARLGYAWDRWLIYATGGLAYGRVEATIANFTGVTDETKWRWGYAVGAGVEMMLMPNWSAKAEYLYVNLGDKTNYRLIAPGNDESVLVRSSIVRVGLNYHFGDSLFGLLH